MTSNGRDVGRLQLVLKKNKSVSYLEYTELAGDWENSRGVDKSNQPETPRDTGIYEVLYVVTSDNK